MDCLRFGKSQQVCCEFYVGSRTNKTLSIVLKTLQFAEAKRIFTDGLKNYKYLITKTVHKVKCYGTNHIEKEESYFAYTSEKAQPKNDLFFQEPCDFGRCFENLLLGMKKVIFEFSKLSFGALKL